LEVELAHAKSSLIPVVIVIDTDPWPSTAAGGTWWDVAVPAVSTRPEVNAKHTEYLKNTQNQRVAD
jgi:3D-(3,5/4)-trihydroxycyclohexane-1,2-dione acylhydrolase (decyclizing)